MGYSPRGHKESDMTERLTLHFHFMFHSLVSALRDTAVNKTDQKKKSTTLLLRF